MFRDVAQKVCGTTLITYGGKQIDLGKPFRRLTMVDAIKEETGIDFDQVSSDEEAKALARERGIEFEDRHKKGDIVNLFFDTYCEDKMIQPTFIMDHPVEISPLTKKKPSDPSKVERFELYINGWEMCNAYSELRLIRESVLPHRTHWRRQAMKKRTIRTKTSCTRWKSACLRPVGLVMV